MYQPQKITNLLSVLKSRKGQEKKDKKVTSYETNSENLIELRAQFNFIFGLKNVL